MSETTTSCELIIIIFNIRKMKTSVNILYDGAPVLACLKGFCVPSHRMAVGRRICYNLMNFSLHAATHET